MASLASTSYTIHYHGGFSGRAQGLDLICEDAGATWKRGSKADAEALKPGMFFAMPAVTNDKGKGCGQTTAAAMWLGSELGYAPAAGFEHVALKMACDIADIWSEGYKARCSKDAAVCGEWLAPGGRFERLLRAVDATKADCASELPAGPFLLGAKPCYADFLLLNAKLTMDFCFGAAAVAPSFATAGAGVSASVEATAERPRIKAFLEKSEPVLYGSVQGMPGSA